MISSVGTLPCKPHHPYPLRFRSADQMTTVVMTSRAMTSSRPTTSGNDARRVRTRRRRIATGEVRAETTRHSASVVDEARNRKREARGESVIISLIGRGAVTNDGRGDVRSGRRAWLVGASLSNIAAAAAVAAETMDDAVAAAVVADERSGSASVPPPLQPPRRPTACTTGTSCVSTASFRSPANFLPPWEYTSSDADAFAQLTRVLRDRPGAVVTVADEESGYVAASLRYGGDDDVDDVEFFLTKDGSKTVLFSSRSRVNRASPPGCFTPGCINGPRNRSRMEGLQRELGWLPLETDEDKKWVPLLLH